jgi:uncharacterized caspase-like protein/TPR repeat protein
MTAVSGMARAEVTADGAEPILKRAAIVIGNSDYASAPDLKNTVSDARLVADFLREHGYVVHERTDVTKRGFEDMLRQVLRDVGKDSEVLFYYAGHGVQIAGGNYLIPVDANLDTAYDVPFETISLNSIVEIVSSRARLQMVILDSCRDNPFGNTRVLTDLTGTMVETREGFATLTAPVNSLLAFSTSPGKVALDGAGSNSPFTEALVEVASASPDMPVLQVFEEVRRLVYQRTEGRQVPWESSTLIEQVSFGAAEDAVLVASNDAGATRPAPRGLVFLTPAMLGEPAVEAAAEATVKLTARLEPEVAIGAALREALGGNPAEPLTIIEAPQSGTLAVMDGDDRRQATGSGEVPGGAIENLVYASSVSDGPAEAVPSPAVTDTFKVAMGGSETRVQLALEPDPCDRAAGDHLDPQGSGLGRYPNEIDLVAARDACAAAVAANPQVGRFHYQLGRAELGLTNLDAAEAAFLKARNLGHTRAIHALGVLAMNREEAVSGRSTDRLQPDALAFLQEAAARGDPYSYHVIGRDLLRFGDSEAERQKGFDLLQRAIEMGHTFSMNELGLYFLDDDSPNPDPQRGLRYLQESAGRGDIYGYNNLGIVYRDGLGGVEADAKTAESWFIKAADGGHPSAPGNLGRMWNSGALGEDGKVAKAVEWYDVGLSRGDGWSGANAAWIIANRDVPGMAPRDAAIRAAKAAALGNAKAAEAAREVLADLPRAAVDAAAQMLVNDLGGSLDVDGAFGPGSRAEMARVLAARGATVAEADPVERAVALARVVWQAGGLRIDLN